MFKTITILFCISLLVGCGGEEEPLYEGLTLNMWINRLESPDAEDRKDALGVIKGIGKKALTAENQVRKIAQNDPFIDVKMLAIETLQAMNVTTVEFQSFITQFETPFTEEVDEEFDYGDEEDFEDEDMIDSEVLVEGYSGEDDLLYLRDLEEGLFDTVEGKSQQDRDDLNKTIPTDPDEYKKWSEEQYKGEVSDLLNQISNPRVLATILSDGESIDKLFAATKLSQMTGADEQIVKALEDASSDPDSTIRRLVKQALEKWEMP
jgi:hypothetical protein